MAKTETGKTEWVRTTLNLHPHERERLQVLMRQGHSIRTVVLVGMDVIERQDESGGGAEVPHREMQAMVRSYVDSAVDAALGERMGAARSRSRGRGAVKRAEPGVGDPVPVNFQAASS